MDEGEKNIYDKLSAKFPGKTLEVQDVSGELPGSLSCMEEANKIGGCGSFYAIEISSSAFKGLSTIKQHKLVNSCLKEDIKTIHGLQVGLGIHFGTETNAD
jgi:stress-induced morphogen